MTEYLIWSNEHLGWWKPGEWGYTTATHKAGRYSKARAEQIVAKANIVPHDPPNEIMVLAPARDKCQWDLEEENVV